MLEKRGAVMETARKVSQILRDNMIDGAVIQGVAVVLRGYIRTTKDVDVVVRQPLEALRPLLESNQFTFETNRREFEHDGVPVHLVPADMALSAPRETIERGGVLTVSLIDLINLKLASGLKSLARAQDIADVVGLIRANNLDTSLTPKLDKSVRSEFKKLVKAVRGG